MNLGGRYTKIYFLCEAFSIRMRDLEFGINILYKSITSSLILRNALRIGCGGSVPRGMTHYLDVATVLRAPARYHSAYNVVAALIDHRDGHNISDRRDKSALGIILFILKLDNSAGRLGD